MRISRKSSKGGDIVKEYNNISWLTGSRITTSKLTVQKNTIAYLIVRLLNHNEKLHSQQRSTNNLYVMKSRILGWAMHFIRIEKLGLKNVDYLVIL